MARKYKPQLLTPDCATTPPPAPATPAGSPRLAVYVAPKTPKLPLFTRVMRATNRVTFWLPFLFSGFVIALGIYYVTH